MWSARREGWVLWPPVRGFCSFGDCTSAARSGALRRCCKRSGGNTKVCSIKICTTLVQARGLCTKHGAHGTCQFDGCTASPRQGSQHCFVHGGGNHKPCSVAGCTTTSQAKGVLRQARRWCSSVLEQWLHQPDSQPAQNLQGARRAWLLFISRLLDACNQNRW